MPIINPQLPIIDTMLEKDVDYHNPNENTQNASF